MDRSWHSVTTYLNDEKTDAAIYGKLFKKLNHVNDALYEVEFAKAEVELKETTIVGFFNLQYAKHQILNSTNSFSLNFVMQTSSESWRWA